jgi:hypothetical protein
MGMTERDETPADGGAAGGEELAALREALLRGYPETVPDLVTGASVAELLASLEPAAAAYRRVVEAARAAAPAVAAPPVPAGNAAPIAIDPAALPSTEKIRRGLAGARGSREGGRG